MSYKDVFTEIDQLQADRIQRFQHAEADSDLAENEAQKKSIITFQQFMEDVGENGLKNMTGLSLSQFEEVFVTCSQNIKPIGKGRRKVADEKTQLLITLVWLQCGFKYAKLGTVFRASTQIIHRIINDTILSIADPLVAYFVPGSPQRLPTAKKFKHFPDAVGACDVALLFVNKPKGFQEQKGWYSGKHKAHGLKLQAIVNPDGLCVHFDLSQRGNIHDKKVFDLSNALDFITVKRNLPNGSVVQSYLPLLFDKGYTGINNYYPNAIVTQRKPIGRDLNEDEQDFNHQVESDRVIVENYFGRMRIKWGILASKFRSDREYLLPNVAKVCIALTNQSVRDSPLRSIAPQPAQTTARSNDESDSSDE